MTKPRHTIINESVVGTYHCMSRCVRRGHLCGVDPITKRNYEHRKEWIEQGLISMARSFFIDVCGYAIMDNHFHVVLRNRPDLAQQATDHQVVRRWRTLFRHGGPKELSQQELEEWLAQKDIVAKWRRRLASPSWFMKRWKEPISKRANREDGIGGHFWESRFKSVALLDDASILACSAYVDLNPIRSAKARTPETSNYTSVQRRIMTHQARKRYTAIEEMNTDSFGRNSKDRLRKWLTYDEWLCPLQDQGGRRGFLKIGLDQYLELLDWTGRQMAKGKDKQGIIPTELAPILTRLEINHQNWLRTCNRFDSLFFRAAGSTSSMAARATEVGQHWFKGKSASKSVFLS